MAETFHVPRNDLDGELALLGTALVSVEKALELVELLTPADFYSDANRRVFEAIQAICSTGGTPDVVAVAHTLRESGRLAQTGGTPYLAGLVDVPYQSDMARTAARIRGMARMRRATNLWRELAAEGAGAAIEDPAAWLESCESRAYTVTSDRDDAANEDDRYGAIMTRVVDASIRAARGDVSALGVRSGFHLLDRHTGGMGPGDLWYVAGRPGSGKTTWAQQVGENMATADPDAGVIMVSLEMPNEQLGLRALARHAGIPTRRIRAGRLETTEWNVLLESRSQLSRLPIVIKYPKNLTALSLRAKIRRELAALRKDRPTLRLRLIVVDYVQLMDLELGRNELGAEGLARLSRSLKQLAGEFGCTVLALSALNRPAKGERVNPPTLHDLRGSGALEADADVVFAIHRPDQYRGPNETPDGAAQFLVLKGRACGDDAHEVRFQGAISRFDNVDRDPPPEEEERYG